MQTFITDFNIRISAQNLDRIRLGNQRNEAIIILKNVLGIQNGWKHHPAVKMWIGYEKFLLYVYITAHIIEWSIRGYKNIKCVKEYNNLSKLLVDRHITDKHMCTPPWITTDFIESHRSNLIKKNRDFYKRLFPNTIEGLPYVWPK